MHKLEDCSAHDFAAYENDIKQTKILHEKLISQDSRDSALKSQIIRIEIYSCYMFQKKKILLFGLCQFQLEKHLSIYSGPISTINFSGHTDRIVRNPQTSFSLR